MNLPIGTIKTKSLLAACAIALLFTVTSCSTTEHARSVTESGFLGDYSQLKPGKEAKLVYVDRSVDWNKYHAVYIEPVELWHSDDPDSKLGKLSQEDQELLVNFFYTSLHTNLARDFHLADQRGPDVLVIHCAITEAKKSRPVANLVTTIIPYGRAANLAKKVVFGSGVGVGEAQVEGEFLDGATGQRIAAVVDRRVGTKALRSKFDGTWGDVKRIMDYWSEHLDERMVELRKEYKKSGQ
jgi:hypothetical protein